MDPVQVEVRSILLNAAWRAYGGRLPVVPDTCPDCRGDGCQACGFTGDPPSLFLSGRAA